MIQGDTVYLYTKPPLWSPLTVRYRAIIESSHRGPQSAKNNHFRELTLAPGVFFLLQMEFRMAICKCTCSYTLPGCSGASRCGWQKTKSAEALRAHLHTRRREEKELMKQQRSLAPVDVHTLQIQMSCTGEMGQRRGEAGGWWWWWGWGV